MEYRQLLKDAAKAAGYVFNVHVEKERERSRAGLWIVGIASDWNPLEDDGDALRLAMLLDLAVVPHVRLGYVETRGAADVKEVIYGRAVCEATRKAIVRAAAEIGKGAVTPNAIAHRPVEAEGRNGSGGATGCAANGKE